MHSVELYRDARTAAGWSAVGIACAWRHARARGGDAPPGRVGADVRAAARADLARTRRGELFPLMVTDGVRGAVVPADRRLPRPVAADLRAGRGAREGGARIFTHTRVTGDRVERRRGARRRDRVGRRSSARSSSTPAGCSPPRSGGMAGVRVPIVPMAHEYLVTQPFRERDARTCRRCATPTPRLLPRGGRRARDGRLRAPLGAVVAGRAPGRPHPARLQRAAARGGLGRASRRSRNARSVRVPAMEDVKVTRLINGPEAFTPDNEFCLGRDRGARASSSPPASARTAWRAPAGSAS